MRCEIVGDFLHIGGNCTYLDDMSSMDLALWVKDNFDDDLETQLRDLFDIDEEADVYDFVEGEFKSAAEFEQAITEISEILFRLENHETN